MFEQLAAAVPSLPRDEGGPVFHEPSEARVSAIALALYQRRVFTWPEWAAALSAAIKRAPAGGDPPRGDTYCRHWLNALGRLVAEKGMIDRASLPRYRDAWCHSARETPHGQPIDLKTEDLRP